MSLTCVVPIQDSCNKGSIHSKQQHLGQCGNVKMAYFDTYHGEEAYEYKHLYDSVVRDYKDCEITIIISGGRLQTFDSDKQTAKTVKEHQVLVHQDEEKCQESE